MSVLLNATYPGPERRSGLDWPRAPAPPHGEFLHVGLVNNMGDAAMGATERQFLTLLEAAAGDMEVHVTLYALPEVERKPLGQRRVRSFYSSIERLWEQPPEHFPDGLIVTGREPLTSDLRSEPYWHSLNHILAWTREHERSAVWSCLGAHAAVLALDGIERVRGPHKRVGIFTCEQAAAHALLAGAPGRLRFPHSRWNGVAADQLAVNGYQVLTRTNDGDVDTFVKQDAALFVFFQGHPEYESETLMGEYRRDVKRYLRGETEAYPSLPVEYFDAQTERSLQEIESRTRTSVREQLLGEVCAVLGGARIQNTWRAAAALLYRNWLEHLSARKRLGCPLAEAGEFSIGRGHH
jgi:homoserine O-succinyltransferase/O-acetyltransferase